MRSCGLAHHGTGQVLGFYPSREEAEAAALECLGDEPAWFGVLGVVAVDFGSDEPTVDPVR